MMKSRSRCATKGISERSMMNDENEKLLGSRMQFNLNYN